MKLTLKYAVALSILISHLHSLPVQGNDDTKQFIKKGFSAWGWGLASIGSLYAGVQGAFGLESYASEMDFYAANVSSRRFCRARAGFARFLVTPCLCAGLLGVISAGKKCFISTRSFLKAIKSDD